MNELQENIATNLFAYEEVIATLYDQFLESDTNTLSIAIKIGALLHEVKSAIGHTSYLCWRRDHIPIHHRLANQMASLYSSRDRLNQEGNIGFYDALKLLTAYHREEVRIQRDAQRARQEHEHQQACTSTEKIISPASSNGTSPSRPIDHTPQIESVTRTLMAFPLEAVVSYARTHIGARNFFLTVARRIYSDEINNDPTG